MNGSSIRKPAALGLLALLLACSFQAWSSHDGARHSILERRASWSEFVELWRQGYSGYRLVDFEMARDGNTTWYYGIWNKGNGRHALYRFTSWGGFTDKWDELSKDGLRLVDIDVYRSGNTTYYTGVFRQGNWGHYLYRYYSWKEFTDKWKQLGNRNMRLVDAEFVGGMKATHSGVSRLIKDTRAYYGVWKSGSDAYALYSQDWSKFTKKWDDLSDNSYRLVDVGLNYDGNTIRYTGVFRAGTGRYAFHKYSEFGSLNAKWSELDARGFTMIDIEAIRIGNKNHYTGVWR